MVIKVIYNFISKNSEKNKQSYCLFQIFLLVLSVFLSVEVKGDLQLNTFSRDYKDLDGLKDVPNFWDLFGEYPKSTGSHDYPSEQYESSPINQGWKMILKF